MSMNLTLHAGEDGPQIDIWQTPTFITLMCLSYNPETKEPDGGQEGVRRRYLEWVESHLTGVWEDDEFELQKERVEEHTKLINSVENPYFSFI
jgi:hypothetical protein